MLHVTDTTAVVLVGGAGTRLRQVVSDRPKPLALINGRPFLAYLLDRLAALGVHRTILCTGYMGDMVAKQLGPAHGPMSLFYSQETAPLGTGGAIRNAMPMVLSDPFLAMNGDSYFSADLKEFVDFHYKRGAQASILLTEVDNTSRYGQVCTDDNGRVTRFEEKGGTGAPGWISAGVYLLSRRFIESIPVGQAASIETQMFPAWIGRGLYACKLPGRFIDIGTPESYREAEEFFSE